MKKCTIGGQAVIEGIMMRSQTSLAVAARKPDGEIELHTEELPNVSKFRKVPIARGVDNLVDMFSMGLRILTWSAKVAGDFEEAEPTKFEKKLAKITGKKLDDIAIVVGLTLGLVMFIALFVILPNVLGYFINKVLSNNIVKNLVEGLIRIIIFVLYLVVVSLLKDIKRVFMYHGAEHKVIACYENEEELTVENAAKHSRLHPRCGTSFLLIVMIVSILVYAVIPYNFHWNGVLVSMPVYGRILLRILLLPIVAGVSYEVLRFASRTDSLWMRILRWPGLQLQRLTTKEPDESMLEVSLCAFNKVLEMDQARANDGVANQEVVEDEIMTEEVQETEQELPLTDTPIEETAANAAVEG